MSNFMEKHYHLTCAESEWRREPLVSAKFDYKLQAMQPIAHLRFTLNASMLTSNAVYVEVLRLGQPELPLRPAHQPAPATRRPGRTAITSGRPRETLFWDLCRSDSAPARRQANRQKPAGANGAAWCATCRAALR